MSSARQMDALTNNACRWTGGKYWLILVMLVAYPSIGRLFRGNPKNAGALYILASALLVAKQLALLFRRCS
jgi:hypothetical protein